jgi:hypothetical protein
MRLLVCSALVAGALLTVARVAHAQDSTYVERRNAAGQDIRTL